VTSHLLAIRDLDRPRLDQLVVRSLALADGAAPTVDLDRRTVGLAFLEPSLRTRVGYAVAANRLGGSAVDVAAPRSSPTAQPEPWTETLRVLSGMVDVVVARTAERLDRATVERWAACPVINGGDGGPGAEHPSQALIDAVAMERFVGPIDELTVGVCGDLTTRCARSLLALLALRPPARLVLVSPPDLGGIDALPEPLRSRAETRDLPDVGDVDVLDAVGLPDGSVPPDRRRTLQVDRRTLDALPGHAVVLSPMPVLDEIETDALDHPRLRVYEQSDLGVFVRMAVLGALLETEPA
jgi:aspartate carbamoyltransferase catalytic subunit